MNRAFPRVGSALATFAVALAMAPSGAVADPNDDAQIPVQERPRLVGLELSGGEGVWRAENRFNLSWKFDASTPKSAVTAVHYRVLDSNLNDVFPPVELAGSPESVLGVRLPAPPGGTLAIPGQYTARVWARGVSDGPVSVVTLRFDDRPPAEAAPRLPTGWIRGDVEPVLQIAHPQGPQPLSGIRGYAVSVRAGSAAPPCAGPERCSEVETDLHAGIGGDTLGLGLLAEGAHVVSVVAVSNSGMRSQRAESAELRIDSTRPDLFLGGSDGGWSNQPVRVIATATDALSGMAASGPTGPRTGIAVDDGPRTVAQGNEVTAIVAGSGIHTVAASARDAAGNVRGEDGASPPLTAVVRIDEVPPSISFARNEDPGEPELLEATVSDGLSGTDISRGSIAVRPLGSGRPFEPLATSFSDGRLFARWDSDSYPKGSYEFRATGFDVAGNAASSTLRAHGASMILANPVKVPVAIHFGFGGRRLVWHRCARVGEGRRCHREVIESFSRRPQERVVPYGQGLSVGGRLVSASGAPLAGYAVDLVESFDAGATIRPRTTSVTTDAEGVFLARLASGPGRRVEARFGGNRILTRAASRDLRLGVLTSVRLRASTATAAIGGDPVVFSGRVGNFGAAIPSFGRPVQLQFRLPGSSWTEFRTVQTDAEGRFRYPYSFSDDDSRGVRFLFRAYAPPQPSWPYEPAASRPVAVTGY
ncbi:MAG: hypothetical protein JJE35_13975 [Thermoleophilia bacterium]|nr:hypothetical protein [Thermoleophilia bacterium]